MKTDSEGKICPFCIENGFVSVISETEMAYLIQAVKDIDGKKVSQIGRYFIIPKQHMESILERPASWTYHENQLLWAALLEAERDEMLEHAMGDRDFLDALNTSWNNGRWAGQRVKHIHMWVIFRYDSLEVGLDGTIELCGRRNGSMALAGIQPVYHEPDDPQF